MWSLDLASNLLSLIFEQVLRGETCSLLHFPVARTLLHFPVARAALSSAIGTPTRRGKDRKLVWQIVNLWTNHVWINTHYIPFLVILGCISDKHPTYSHCCWLLVKSRVYPIVSPTFFARKTWSRDFTKFDPPKKNIRWFWKSPKTPKPSVTPAS